MTAHPNSENAPEAKLRRKIENIYTRLVRGKKARDRWQVKVQRLLRVTSVVLSSLGSAGIIAAKASGNLAGENGWAFTGSIIVLAFGVLLQISSELGIEWIANQSRIVADACELIEEQLDIMAEAENPIRGVDQVHEQLTALVLKYHAAFIARSPALRAEAMELARALVEQHRADWHLPQRTRKETKGNGAGAGTLPPAPDDTDAGGDP